jgi:hypothetical protein
MGYSRTPTQKTAGDGFPADPIDGTARVTVWPSCDPPSASAAFRALTSGLLVDGIGLLVKRSACGTCRPWVWRL